MAGQRRAILEIDAESGRNAASFSERSSRGAVSSAARLLTSPFFRFVRALVIRPAAPGGGSRFIRAVNAWALEFVTEAKRYERSHEDRGALLEKTRDFR